MNAQQVFDHIEKIAATASKTEKQALVKAAINDPLFLRIMQATYDPFTTYGLRVLPEPTGVGELTLDSPLPWSVLDKLASRALSGDSARLAVDLMLTRHLDAASGALAWRIIKGDMRAGFSESTINKARPGTILEFPYMRCSLPAKSHMDGWDWSLGIFSQIKADGSFANVNLDDQGNLRITTRQGTPYPDGITGVEGSICSTFTPGTQTHGEMIIFKDGKMMSRQKGNGVLNSLLKGGQLEADEEVVFYAWDQIPMSAVKPKAKIDTPYKERFTSLVKQVATAKQEQVRIIETAICRTKAAAFAHNRAALARGLEGTVCKHPGLNWFDSGSGASKDQVKLKVEFTVELRVKGYIPGEGKNAATFGSLACESECGKLKVNVSGISDALRKQIHENRAHYLDSIIAVTANSIMPAKNDESFSSLFLPRMDVFRNDKSVADTLQHIQDQYDALVAA